MKPFSVLALIAPAFAAAQLPPPVASPLVGARSLALSPNGKRLAFSYQGDIWIASADGGRATPLTNNVEMDDNPIWSPDGNYVAFSSNRAGNNDIYVVPANGGQTQRLTWHSGSDVPSDWSPDGKFIIERTTRDAPYNGLYAIEVATGKAHQLLLDPMPVGSPHYSPDGKTVLYSRIGFPWFRPRYQGSGAAQLWKLDLATGKRTAVRDTGFQNLWAGYAPDGRVYTVTVDEKTPSSSPLNHPIPKIVDNVRRTPNVYEVTSSSRRVTDFVEEGPRFLTLASKAPVAAFERDGDVYVMPLSGKPKKIELTASIDDKTTQEERLVLTGGATDMAVSPKGDRIAFVVRGEIWMVPTKKGKGPNADDAVQLTDWAGLDEQPLWAPDGKTLFFVSDRNGPARLFKMDVDAKKIEEVSHGQDVVGLRLTPDKTRVSYWMGGAEGGLYTVPVAGGTPTRILAKTGQYSGDLDDAYDWSPDGRYLAYSDVLQRSGYYYWDSTTNIFVIDTQTGKSTNVTKLSANHVLPKFTPDGKYLLMRSDRDGAGLYAIALKPEEVAPAEVEMKYEKPTGPVKVEIDFDGIESRPRKILSQNVSSYDLDATNGDLYFVADGNLWKANYAGEEARQLVAAAPAETPPGDPNPRRRFRAATDGSGPVIMGEINPEVGQLSYLRGGTLNVMDLRKPQNPVNTVAFRADWLHDLRKERMAAYDQFWRAYNRGFYDPNFHGRDWTALKARYEKFLPSVGHRNEMATVLNELVGELESSHSEVSPAPGNPRGSTSAHPGFTFDYDYAGPGIKIKEVPKGSPGSFAKTRLTPGEIVTAINGKPVNADEALWRDVLADQAGRDITLTVRGSDGKTRDVKYRALTSGEYGAIVTRNLLEARRRHVEERSKGKLTYVHIAAMDAASLNRFNQQVWEYAQDKKGLIIDVRGNGGGNTADQIIDVLERKPNMYYQLRDQAPILGPGQALAMPMAVMIAQNSFSNAEMFPAAMKARDLATLVGMPTPGYVIYTGGLTLVDGTGARMPGTGTFRLDGSPLEDNGQQPDVRVDLTPEQFFAGEDPQLDAAIDALMRQVK